MAGGSKLGNFTVLVVILAVVLGAAWYLFGNQETNTNAATNVPAQNVNTPVNDVTNSVITSTNESVGGADPEYFQDPDESFRVVLPEGWEGVKNDSTWEQARGAYTLTSPDAGAVVVTVFSSQADIPISLIVGENAAPSSQVTVDTIQAAKYNVRNEKDGTTTHVVIVEGDESSFVISGDSSAVERVISLIEF
ncbi:MAG: hypothetical protein WC289_04320 [Patescibacteria group bacterium]|jgi:hypothetical protein